VERRAPLRLKELAVLESDPKVETYAGCTIIFRKGGIREGVAFAIKALVQINGFLCCSKGGEEFRKHNLAINMHF